MNEILRTGYEKADYLLKNFMGMVEKNVSWPNRELVRCFTNRFSELLDGLQREQACLIDALWRKEQRITEQEAETWAELEEI